jgi:hypothetical protein
MTKASRFAAGLLALSTSVAGAGTVWAAPGPAPCGPGAQGVYPSFCDIPRTPTDLRGPTAYGAAVVDTRQAGRRVVRATGPETFGLPLGDAAAFSREARAEAAPPPELSAAPPEDSAAVAAELRKRATPPPRRPR